jgi:hypothetical protein
MDKNVPGEAAAITLGIGFNLSSHNFYPQAKMPN